VVNWNAERRLANAVNVSDIRDCAKQRAHKMVFDYLDSGADDEVTLRRNKDAFVDLEFHYKVLAGLKPPLDLSTRVLGNDVEVPFFPSPTAGSKMFHADGEIGIARAAKKVGAMYCLSTMGTTSPRDLAASLGTDSSGTALGVSQIRQHAVCTYSYQKERLTSALTVCPYIAIYKTDTFFASSQRHAVQPQERTHQAHDVVAADETQAYFRHPRAVRARVHRGAYHRAGHEG
jgi:hypothetical protein